jgi:hypothetical protein
MILEEQLTSDKLLDSSVLERSVASMSCLSLTCDPWIHIRFSSLHNKPQVGLNNRSFTTPSHLVLLSLRYPPSLEHPPVSLEHLPVFSGTNCILSAAWNHGSQFTAFQAKESLTALHARKMNYLCIFTLVIKGIRDYIISTAFYFYLDAYLCLLLRCSIELQTNTWNSLILEMTIMGSSHRVMAWFGSKKGA